MFEIKQNDNAFRARELTRDSFSYLSRVARVHEYDLYLGGGARVEARLSATLSIISSTSVATFISAINPRQVIKLNDPRSLDHPARKCLFIPTPFKRLRDLPLPRERCVNFESPRPFQFLQLLSPLTTIDFETRGRRSYVRIFDSKLI